MNGWWWPSPAFKVALDSMAGEDHNEGTAMSYNLGLLIKQLVLLTAAERKLRM